ncbi:hypothetical protein ILYODFUR_002122 [Ilyodon furcidens]|uniref:Uncharacterized protein n=1 Tax=Ilyodon furcidens TaxID=33524 RepID=A0ABV0TFD9_9TELE
MLKNVSLLENRHCKKYDNVTHFEAGVILLRLSSVTVVKWTQFKSTVLSNTAQRIKTMIPSSFSHTFRGNLTPELGFPPKKFPFNQARSLLVPCLPTAHGASLCNNMKY